MHIDKPTLFLEINDNYFVFLVVKYSDDQNYKIITHSKIVSKGLKNSKIVDVKTSSILIKDNIEKIEKEINYIFRDINIISDLNSIRCINVSGFKKLNGSQVLEENVTYIMNNLKKSIMENELEFTLIHLFNSKYFLDKIETTNLPVGLYGNLYQHEMTFFLLPKNDLKNLKLVLNNLFVNIVNTLKNIVNLDSLSSKFNFA